MRRKAKRRSRHPGLTDNEIDDVRARKRESRRSAAPEPRDGGSSGSGAEDNYAPPPPPVGFGRMPGWFKKFVG